MTHEQLTTLISSNLKQVADLNDYIRAINANLKTNLANGHWHLLTDIEVKTSQIANLVFWINHWTEALKTA